MLFHIFVVVTSMNIIIINGEYHYELNSDQLSWGAAKTNCESNGKRLAVLDTYTKFQEATDFLQTQSVSHDIWIGLERKKYIYQWIDGTVLTYLAWDTAAGEPSGRSNENCIRIEKKSLLMKDISCSSWYTFLCEAFQDIAPGMTLSETTPTPNTTTTTSRLATSTTFTSTTTPNAPFTTISTASAASTPLTTTYTTSTTSSATTTLTTTSASTKTCTTASAAATTSTTTVTATSAPTATTKSTTSITTSITLTQAVSTTSALTTMYATTATTKSATTSIALTPAVSTLRSICRCPCYEVGDPAVQNMTVADTLEAVKQLRKELLVDKSELSSFKRKKISAPDERSSSKGIGALGIVLLIGILCMLLITDAPVLCRDLKNLFKNVGISK